MQELTKDILNYMEFLRSSGLYVIVCEEDYAFRDYKRQFFSYKLHDNPYCLAVKANAAAHSHCMECKYLSAKKAQNGAFWGMCHAGCEEYIFPILSKETSGIVCVSGYGVNREKAYDKIRAVSENCMMNKRRLKALYEQNLIHEKPDLKQTAALIKPLCRMLGILADEIAKIPESYSKNSTDYAYSKALTYINYNYRNEINLASISGYCNCSPSLISHIFRKKSGVGIRKYINQLRMKEAKALLKNSSLPVKDIAFMTGFSDSNYFSNIFKKICGVSPVQYRRAASESKECL